MNQAKSRPYRSSKLERCTWQSIKTVISLSKTLEICSTSFTLLVPLRPGLEFTDVLVAAMRWCPLPSILYRRRIITSTTACKVTSGGN